MSAVETLPRGGKRFGQPDGPKPGRPRGILVGKKRAAALRRAAAIAEASRPPEAERVHVHPRAYFQALLDDVALPHEVRGAAARSLSQFYFEDQKPPAQIDWGKLTPEQRERARAALTLLAQLQRQTGGTKRTGPTIDGEATSAEPKTKRQPSRVAPRPLPIEAKTDDSGASPSSLPGGAAQGKADPT